MYKCSSPSFPGDGQEWQWWAGANWAQLICAHDSLSRESPNLLHRPSTAQFLKTHVGLDSPARRIIWAFWRLYLTIILSHKSSNLISQSSVVYWSPVTHILTCFMSQSSAMPWLSLDIWVFTQIEKGVLTVHCKIVSFFLARQGALWGLAFYLHLLWYFMILKQVGHPPGGSYKAERPTEKIEILTCTLKVLSVRLHRTGWFFSLAALLKVLSTKSS